jgi:hypothetical protein
MAVRVDCRHYLARTISSGEIAQRCRLGAATEVPFTCPDACILWEERAVSAAGWAQAPRTPMSNTADGLAAMPPQKRRRGKGDPGKGGKGRR